MGKKLLKIITGLFRGNPPDREAKLRVHRLHNLLVSRGYKPWGDGETWVLDSTPRIAVSVLKNSNYIQLYIPIPASDLFASEFRYTVFSTGPTKVDVWGPNLIDIKTPDGLVFAREFLALCRHVGSPDSKSIEFIGGSFSAHDLAILLSEVR